MMELSPVRWVAHILRHPVDGFEDMRWKKSGSLKIAFFIVFMLFLANIANERLYGFNHYIPYDRIFNVVPYIVKSFVIFGAWTVGNWSVCSLLDGEGKMRNICIYSAYALIPYTAQMFINTILSHFLIRDEYVFMAIIRIIGIVWSAVLLFSAIRSVHQYSATKTIAAIALTIGAMAIMLALLVLFLSLIQHVLIFFSTLFTEISYRIRS
ncbi:MAG: YIP1 family protein [Ruminococcus sp.]|nr:YIP1 family protein [Ruminococcus sp.]